LHSAELFKALSDPIRLRLVYLLTRREELCVCHFTEVLGLPQSTISRHLSHLRHLDLVGTRREGKWVYYHLSSRHDTIAAQVLGLISRLGADEPQLVTDAEKLPASTCQ